MGGAAVLACFPAGLLFAPAGATFRFFEAAACGAAEAACVAEVVLAVWSKELLEVAVRAAPSARVKVGGPSMNGTRSAVLVLSLEVARSDGYHSKFKPTKACTSTPKAAAISSGRSSAPAMKNCACGRARCVVGENTRAHGAAGAID